MLNEEDTTTLEKKTLKKLLKVQDSSERCKNSILENGRANFDRYEMFISA